LYYDSFVIRIARKRHHPASGRRLFAAVTFSYALSLPVTWQRRRSAVAKNPMLHANIAALWFTERELGCCRSNFYIAGNGNFRHFGLCELVLDPMTFIYEYIVFLGGIGLPHVRIWISYVMAFESYAYLLTDGGPDRQINNNPLYYG